MHFVRIPLVIIWYHLQSLVSFNIAYDLYSFLLLGCIFRIEILKLIFFFYILSLLEMCDFIRTENIKSVIEHIATKYLGQKQYSSSSISDSPIKRIPSLEDVATPYVDTLTLLRQKYEENKTLSNLKVGSNDTSTDNENQNRLMQNEKAREDQVRHLRTICSFQHFYRHSPHCSIFLHYY